MSPPLGLLAPAPVYFLPLVPSPGLRVRPLPADRPTTWILSWLRFAGSTLIAVVLLRGEWNGTRSGVRQRQADEGGEVGVKRYPIQPAYPECGEPVVMLQVAELTLDRSTAPIEIAATLRLVRDKRVAATGLAPDGGRPTLVSRTATLGRLPAEVGSSKGPSSVPARRRAVVLHTRTPVAIRRLPGLMGFRRHLGNGTGGAEH
jgi:hypothetical protein